MKIYLSGALISALWLAACGGGGGGSSSDGGGNTSTTLSPTTYAVYKNGQQAALSGAGAVSNPTASGGNLSLGADGTTTLSVTNASTFAMSASTKPFLVVNRQKGAVLMLCDQLPTGGKPGDTLARYVAFATNSATADTQGVPVTDAAELAGKSFYEIAECGYVKDNSSSQQQNSAPTGATLEYRVDASGNLRGSNGLVFSAATVTGFLNGTASVDSNGRQFWFNAYKFIVAGTPKIYFAIRGEPNKDANGNPIDEGFVVLWTDDPSSDVTGCSLNCTAPTDALPVTSPASVTGVYLTEYGFGEEISALWINSSGKYLFGFGAPAGSLFNPGLEIGTLSFDANGNVSATKTYDTNGTGEAVNWTASATKLVSAPVADPARRAVFERVAKDPANLLLGAWALTTCGSTTGISSTDPTQAFSVTFLKSGHYLVLDTFGNVNNPSPIPGVEYGTFAQDSTAGTFQYTGNLYDTNAEAGVWSPATSSANGGVRNYTISADGNTMTITTTGDGCGTATLSRIN